MPIHKAEIYLAKVFGKEPYWPFHFPEKNVIYDFYGSKQLEQEPTKAEPCNGASYFLMHSSSNAVTIDMTINISDFV